MKFSPELSFREYLKNELDRRMTNNSAYSMRAFARDLDMPVSRLSELLSGKSGVSLIRVKEIASNLKLSPTEAQFVEDLATLDFGKTNESKKSASLRISNLNKKNAKAMTAQDFEEISDWYYFAILEVISKVETKTQYSDLSAQIGIKESLCQFAIERLLRKGLIIESDGVWKSTNKSMTVIGESKLSIQKFHKQFVHESIKCFDHSEFNDREFSSTFVMLTEEEIQELRKKIRQTVESVFFDITQRRQQKQIEKLSLPVNKDDLKLYGLGVQLFPVKINPDTSTTAEINI